MSLLIMAIHLDPQTSRSINRWQHNCGCHQRDTKWFICDYHEGYDAALKERHAIDYDVKAPD